MDWTIYICFAGAVGVLMAPARLRKAPHWVALATAGCALGAAVASVCAFPPGDGFRTIVKEAWVPALGIDYFLGVDGISSVMVLLTGIASVTGVLFSWNIEKQPRGYFALYLVLIGASFGVFLSFDAFLLFVFYELAIIPKYFLIAIWGSTRREYGAMKLALYSFLGSGMVLAGLLAGYAGSGGGTLDLIRLSQAGIAVPLQLWAFPLVFVGFGILAGLWPFHTWAPTGHVAAPTGASMLLAGVVMKLGAYGALRVAMPLFPAGLEVWRGAFAVLGCVGIVYGALVALVQKDFKFVIGYSSVSHMGFVVLGLMTVTVVGISGAVLQMFSHGILAGLLFGVVGRMVYDRTHTRDLEALQGMDLSRMLPFAAVTFVVAGLASMGMPGFSGFVAELQVLIGAWRMQPWLAVIAGVGILIGVVYTLRAMHQAFFSGAAEEVDADPSERIIRWPGGKPERMSLPERAGAVVLMGTTLAIGLYPGWMIGWIQSSLASPLFEGMRTRMNL